MKGHIFLCKQNKSEIIINDRIFFSYESVSLRDKCSVFIYFQFIYFMLVCTLHDNTQPVSLSFLKASTAESFPVLGICSPFLKGDGILIPRASLSAWPCEVSHEVVWLRKAFTSLFQDRVLEHPRHGSHQEPAFCFHWSLRFSLGIWSHAPYFSSRKNVVGRVF